MSAAAEMLTAHSEVVAALLGAAVGFGLSELKDWFWRIRRRRAQWRALSAEVELCRETAEVFLDDPIKAPLYRLPVLTYLNSFPALLAEGIPTEKETRAITRFFSQVQTLNRGLDQANEARDQEHLLNKEYGRNRIKAEKLIQTGSYYTEVRAVLTRRAR
jgi:hypothetical protein